MSWSNWVIFIGVALVLYWLEDAISEIKDRLSNIEKILNELQSDRFTSNGD
jgi:hypothetical protein